MYDCNRAPHKSAPAVVVAVAVVAVAVAVELAALAVAAARGAVVEEVAEELGQVVLYAHALFRSTTRAAVDHDEVVEAEVHYRSEGRIDESW